MAEVFMFYFRNINILFVFQKVLHINFTDNEKVYELEL